MGLGLPPGVAEASREGSLEASRETSLELERERFLESLDAYQRGLSDAPLLRKWSAGGAGIAAEAGVTAENAANEMTFVISTDDVDRHGDVIVSEGWALDAYQRNPVFLWAHDYLRPVIGKAVLVWKERHGLLARMEFAPTDFAQEVASLYRGGYQRGVSVGFKPIRYEERRNEQTGAFQGIRFLEQELLEVSAVPVPANRSALRRSADNLRKEILDGAGTAGNAAATKHGFWQDGAANTDRWDDFGGWRSFFYGLVDSIVPNPAKGSQSCRLRAYDELHRLGDVLVFNLISGANLRAGAIINDVLTWSGFSVNDRELDNGRVLIFTQPRALWRRSARQALYAVQDEEDGFIYIDGLGYLRLEESSHRSSGSHSASRATLRDTKATSPYVSELSWDDGSAGVENDVTFRYHLEDDQGLQEIWRLRDVPAIPAGESRDLLAESRAYDVVDSIRTPVATTDYTANSESDGSGFDMTSDLTVTLPLTDDFQGKGTVVRVANNHSTDTAYVTLLKLRADASFQDFESTIYQTEDAASQSDHGERSRQINCVYIDTYATAKAVADERLARKKDRKTRLSLTLPNGDRNNLMQMVHRVLSDRITVVYSDMGISQDFFIEHMELEAVASTGEVTVRWLMQGV